MYSTCMYTFLSVSQPGHSCTTPHAGGAKDVCLIESLSYFKVEFCFLTYLAQSSADIYRDFQRSKVHFVHASAYSFQIMHQIL